MDESSSEESSDSEQDEIHKKFYQLLTQARTCFQGKIFGPAFAQYLILIKSQKSLRNVLNEEFIAVLDCWTDQLISEGKIEQAFNCFKQAKAFYPRNAALYNKLGSTLFKLGFYNEASAHLKTAIEIDPSLCDVKESLESVSNLLVERWHFRMLNDHIRNNAYMAAIERAVHQGYDVVLDIGSGTGILSMFAARAGAKDVYACEMNEVMCEMSRKILRANQMESKVKLINKKSADIKIGLDIPNNVTLIVTEIMDCALLGEGIIPTLKHAWEHLALTNRCFPLVTRDSGNQNENSYQQEIKPRTKVIPSAATILAMIIECKTIRTQNRLDKEICGLKIPAVRGADTEYGSKRCFDPYGSEYINSIRDGFAPLSKPFVIAKYDFSYTGGFVFDSHKELRVPVTANGLVDAIIVWFDLHLDKMTCISTAPWSENLCWEQAVYPAQFQSLLTGDSYTVSPGCEVLISARLNENYVKLEMLEIKRFGNAGNGCTNVDDIPIDMCGDASVCKNSGNACADVYGNQRDICWDVHVCGNAGDACAGDACRNPDVCWDVDDGNGTEKKQELTSENESMEHQEMHMDSRSVETGSSVWQNNSKPFLLSCSDIRRLNDETYQRGLLNAIKTSFDFLNQTASLGKISVLDMSDAVPLSPIFAALVTNNHITLLKQKNETYDFVMKVAQMNGADGFITCTKNTLQDLISCGDKFNIIVADVVEACGILRQKVLEEILLVKECLSYAYHHVIIPSQIKIHGQCISCLELAKENRIINNDVTLGLDIARFMNTYSVDTHIDVDLAAKNSKALTEQFEILDIDLMGNAQRHCTRHKVLTRVITDGIITGIPYWFELYLSPQTRLSTGPGGYEESHWHQAVVILKEGVEVCEGDELCITCLFKDSCLSLSVTKL